MKTLTPIICAIGLALMLAACNSETTITEYDSNGKVVKTTTTTSESAARHKDFAIGGAITAVKVETTGSSSSGTLLPNFIIGGGATGVASSPSESTRPVINFSRSAGVLSSLTNSSAYSGSLNYIGTPGETSAETAARLKGVLGALTESASADSSSSN